MSRWSRSWRRRTPEVHGGARDADGGRGLDLPHTGAFAGALGEDDQHRQACGSTIGGRTMKLLTVAAAAFSAEAQLARRDVTRWGRPDLAEVCCTAHSVLSGCVIELGGMTRRYSDWNGYIDLTKGGSYAAAHGTPKRTTASGLLLTAVWAGFGHAERKPVNTQAGLGPCTKTTSSTTHPEAHQDDRT